VDVRELVRKRRQRRLCLLEVDRAATSDGDGDRIELALLDLVGVRDRGELDTLAVLERRRDHHEDDEEHQHHVDERRDVDDRSAVTPRLAWRRS
jgi:hypothetical protein